MNTPDIQPSQFSEGRVPESTTEPTNVTTQKTDQEARSTLKRSSDDPQEAKAPLTGRGQDRNSPKEPEFKPPEDLTDRIELENWFVAKYVKGKSWPGNDIQGLVEKALAFEDPEERFRVLLALANRKGGKVLPLDRLNFTPSQRFILAQVLAIKGSDTLLKKIGALDLSPQEHYEIAKLLSDRYFFQVHNNRDFNLTNEQRVEIAKIMASSCVGQFSMDPTLFTNEQDRADIALILARNHPNSVDLESFLIKNQTHLVNIIRACLESEESAFIIASEIPRISNELERFNLAMLAAQKYGWALPGIMEKLDLTREHRFQIAIQLALNGEHNLGPDIAKFDLDVKQKEKVAKLLSASLAQKDAILSLGLEFFKIDDSANYRVMEHLAKKNGPSLLKLIKTTAECKPTPQLLALAKMSNPQADMNPDSKIEDLDGLFNQAFTPEQKAWLQAQGLIEELKELRTPELRPELFQRMLHIVKDENLKARFQELSKNKSKSQALMWVFLEAQGVDIEPLKSTPKASDSKKNDQAALILSQFIDYDLDPAKKSAIIRRLETDGIAKSLGYLQALMGFRRVESIDLTKPLFESLKAVFTEQLPFLNEVENFGEKWTREIEGKFRSYSLLLVFAGKISTLPEKEALLNQLGIFLLETFNGIFPDERYTYLEDQFPEPIVHAWKGASRSESFIEEEITPEKTNYLGVLRWNILEDGHLKIDDYPYLKAYFEGKKEAKEILKDLGAELKQNSTNQQLILQQKLINLAKGSDNPELLLKQAREALEKIPPHAELLNDLRAWEGTESAKKGSKEKVSKKNWTVAISDRPDDLFLCGSDVGDSCQRVEGDPAYNKCLLGYIAHGATRIVAVKDANGRIKGRAMLRLMKNDAGEPVLFLEQVYPKLEANTYKPSLVKMAKKLADEMGVPLYSPHKSETPLNGTLHSAQNGSAPYEYSDASDGEHTRPSGEFTISRAYQVTGAPIEVPEKPKAEQPR